MIDQTRTLEESKKIKILGATPEVPFKRLILEGDFQENLNQQWKDAILIKVLGKPWFYPAMVAKLDSLWGLRGTGEIIDLGHGCFFLKGISEEKRDLILTGGPWQLAGSFLSIRKWKPNFQADNDKVETTITWVRVLNLPVEFFRESIIQSIVSCIGEPLKIDGNTFNASRGKFASFVYKFALMFRWSLGWV